MDQEAHLGCCTEPRTGQHTLIRLGEGYSEEWSHGVESWLWVGIRVLLHSGCCSFNSGGVSVCEVSQDGGSKSPQLCICAHVDAQLLSKAC